MEQKKLWVWENVLDSYTAGVVFAYAETEEQAWKEVKKVDRTAWWVLRGHPEDRDDPRTVDELAEDDEVIRPKLIQCSSAYVVWGGD